MILEDALFICSLDPTLHWLPTYLQKEVKQPIRTELDRIQQQIKQLNQEKTAFKQKYTLWKDSWILEMLLEEIDKDISLWQKKIKRLNYYLSPQKTIKYDIEHVKQQPITDYYPGELKRAGPKRLKGLCPFHTEKTPSFIVYTDQNTFHCYGCGTNGDVIDFVMNLENMDFLEAVRYILRN